MKRNDLDCPLCGATAPQGTLDGCAGCPLGPRCGMVCCPSCGYSWVDPGHTRLGRLLHRWFHPTHAPHGRHARRSDRGPWPLADVPVGSRARLCGWERTPASRRRQLRAYGVCEDAWLQVLQHSPATVIRVGQTELALERDLAATILVDRPQPTAASGDSESTESG